jgi:SAM-dependent methyltransferase
MKPIDESIIESLDGTDIRLREYIPYLLQDIWEIGADPETMTSLIKEHVDISNPRILDLGCGKGAVSIRMAQEVECTVFGIDAVPEFIKEANEYARKFNVYNTDGIFNRFVTVFANRARHVSGELSLGREAKAI